MAYKIAVASSDGIHVDLSFGAAPSFLIYEVDGNSSFYLKDTRTYHRNLEQETVSDSGSGAGGQKSCQGHGCGEQSGHFAKIALVEDCRCVLCRKIGFQAQKQLEKKTIAVFAIETEIERALGRIVQYFDRVDHHRSLQNIAK